MLTIFSLMGLSYCGSKIDSEKKKFTLLLVGEMVSASTDSEYLTIDNCVIKYVKILEQITGIKSRLNKSHWGVHYSNISDMKSDSLAYSNEIEQMTSTELDSAINRNCSSIIKLLSKSCVMDLEKSSNYCFTSDLQSTCVNVEGY